MDFSNAVVNGIPILFVIFGLTAWIKSLGVHGKALTATSFAIGILAGVLYQYSLMPMVGFAAWFGAVIYGLALGIVASGVYKGIESATQPKPIDLQSFTASLDRQEG